MSLMLVFTVGCEKNSNDEEPTDKYTYSAVFQLLSLSDTYFDFGTLTLNYLDSDGLTKSVNVTKDLIPGKIVTVEGLSSSDAYSFELCFDRLETLPSLTEEEYEFFFTYKVYYEGSEGGQIDLCGQTETYSVPVENIEEYVDTETSLVTQSGSLWQ